MAKARRKKNKIHIEMATFLSFVVALIIIAGIALIAPRIGRWAVVKDTDRVVSQVRAAIEKEKKYAHSQAKEIALSGILDYCQDNARYEEAETKVIEEKRIRNLSAVIVVCPNGLTLSRRIPGQSSSGDYALLTTDYGRATGQGKSVAVIGEPNTFPIAVVGTYPIFENGQFLGAVFAGNRLDDDFTDRFKAKYLAKNIELVFYSKKDGVTGHNTSDKETDEIIHAYFSYGSDWVQEGRNNELVIVKTEKSNNFYYLKNLQFSGLENKQPGGVVVFVGYNFYLMALFLAGLLSVIYYFISMVLHNRYKLDWAPIHLITAILIFSYGLIIFEYGLGKSSVVLYQPSQTIYNSTLHITPEAGVIDLSHSQKIDVQLSSGGEPINTIYLKIDYDAEEVLVEDILLVQSVCHPDLIFENEIDNDAGYVRFGCSIPNPGFFGRDGGIVSLMIRPLGTGSIGFTFGPETRVLANDGVGTDVLRTTTGAGYRVLDYRLVNLSNQIDQVLLFSPSHPNSMRWYNKEILFMYWPQISGVRYFYSIDKNPDGEALLSQELSSNYLSALLEGDGEYYVHVQAQKSDGSYTNTGHYPIRLDFTPPEKPIVKASHSQLKIGEILRLSIETTDSMSGLQRAYYYRVDDSILLPTGENINIYFIDPGEHNVMVRVFDKAGNYSDTILRVKVIK